mmetsp:Transcript_95501/g.273931  ORF Transcript_95501/g.273931 Transcript_95501/m.273931 type:complete len:219 (+) Transcript_95501:584-1240(+)
MCLGPRLRPCGGICCDSAYSSSRGGHSIIGWTARLHLSLWICTTALRVKSKVSWPRDARAAVRRTPLLWSVWVPMLPFLTNCLRCKDQLAKGTFWISWECRRTSSSFARGVPWGHFDSSRRAGCWNAMRTKRATSDVVPLCLTRSTQSGWMYWRLPQKPRSEATALPWPRSEAARTQSGPRGLRSLSTAWHRPGRHATSWPWRSLCISIGSFYRSTWP